MQRTKFHLSISHLIEFWHFSYRSAILHFGDREKPLPCQEKRQKKLNIGKSSETGQWAGDANATCRQFSARAGPRNTSGRKARIKSTGVRLAHSKEICLFHACRARRKSRYYQ